MEVSIEKINSEGKSRDSAIFEAIYAENGEDYYTIFGLKLYAVCSQEHLKRVYAQKIVDFIYELQDEDFSVKLIDYEKPKIGKEHRYSIFNSTEPTKKHVI